MTYRVRVPVYEGPLDLLLYLIKRDELDICDIPIAQITKEYLEYLELMQLLDLGIAGDFLVMAATLIHIKSKVLLPPQELTPEEQEEDPRQDLVNRLVEYQKVKEAAGFLGERENERLFLFTRPGAVDQPKPETEYIEASIFDLIGSFSKILGTLPEQDLQQIPEDEFTIEDKMGMITGTIKTKGKIRFTSLFESMHNRTEVVTTFLALLELIRLKEVVVRQTDAFGDIFLLPSESLNGTRRS